MLAKDQKFIRHWQQQMQKGKANYMLTRGIVWGIFAAAITTLFRISNNSLSELYLSTEFLVKLMVMIIAGILLHSWQWSYNNKKYDRLLQEEQDQSTAQ